MSHTEPVGPPQPSQGRLPADARASSGDEDARTGRTQSAVGGGRDRSSDRARLHGLGRRSRGRGAEWSEVSPGPGHRSPAGRCSDGAGFMGAVCQTRFGPTASTIAPDRSLRYAGRPSAAPRDGSPTAAGWPVPRRQDGSVSPQSAPDVRIVPGHAELVLGVVVAVHQVPQQEVGERGETVGHARGMNSPGPRRRRGRGSGSPPRSASPPRRSWSTTRAVPAQHVPVVGLVEVVVEAHDGAGLLLGPVGLDHLAARAATRSAVGLDEPSPLVPVDVGLDHDDVGDGVGGVDVGHGAHVARARLEATVAACGRKRPKPPR